MELLMCVSLPSFTYSYAESLENSSVLESLSPIVLKVSVDFMTDTQYQAVLTATLCHILSFCMYPCLLFVLTYCFIVILQLKAEAAPEDGTYW